MAKEAHFIVVVKDDGTFDYDFDVSINFDNGQIWDTETEQWFTPNDSPEHNFAYREGLSILTNQLNKQEKTWDEAIQMVLSVIDEMQSQYPNYDYDIETLSELAQRIV